MFNSSRGFYARVTYTKKGSAAEANPRTRDDEQPSAFCDPAASYYNDDDLFRAISLDEPRKPVRLSIISDAVSCESIAVHKSGTLSETDDSIPRIPPSCPEKPHRKLENAHTYVNAPLPYTGLF